MSKPTAIAISAPVKSEKSARGITLPIRVSDLSFSSFGSVFTSFAASFVVSRLGLPFLLPFTAAGTLLLLLLLLLIPLAFPSCTSWNISASGLRTEGILSCQGVMPSSMIPVFLTNTATNLAHCTRLSMISEQSLDLTSLFRSLPGAQLGAMTATLAIETSS
jgi:hypothetical protein